MRQAEVCGLTWDRVDSKRRTITAWQVLTQVPHAHGCQGEWGGRSISPCTLAAREAVGDPDLVIPARSCPQRVTGGWFIDTDTKAHRQRPRTDHEGCRRRPQGTPRAAAPHRVEAGHR